MTGNMVLRGILGLREGSYKKTKIIAPEASLLSLLLDYHIKESEPDGQISVTHE
jgi:hypothetical protein